MVSSLEKILGIASLGSTIANAAVFKRFLSRVMITVALAAAAGAMTGMLMLAGFYGVYWALVAYGGLTQLKAGLLVGGMVILATILMAVFAYRRWQQLHDLGSHFDSRDSIMGRVSQLADSFIDGLMAERGE